MPRRTLIKREKVGQKTDMEDYPDIFRDLDDFEEADEPNETGAEKLARLARERVASEQHRPLSRRKKV